MYFGVLIKPTTTLKEKNIKIPQVKYEFRIKTSKYKNGEEIPNKYTPYDKDIHPSFHWYGYPKEIKSFAIICEDPDTSSGKNFTH